MRKSVKISLIALLLSFASLLTACSANNNKNGEIKASDSGMVTKEESQIDIPETSSDTTPAVSPETSAAENENIIQLNVHASPPTEADKGGLFAFDYNGKEYKFPIIDCYNSYIIDKDKNVLDPETDNMELDSDCRIDAAMMEFGNFEYLGRVGETFLGNISFNEANLYTYGDDLILIYNSDNVVRYHPETCEKLYDIEFTDEERLQLTNGTIDFEKTLQDHGVEYDPGIFFTAFLYEPER